MEKLTHSKQANKNNILNIITTSKIKKFFRQLKEDLKKT